jgi:STE24 endopeptidase
MFFFIALRCIRQFIESGLLLLNQSLCKNPGAYGKATTHLGLNFESQKDSLAYALEKQNLSHVSAYVSLAITVGLVVFGGFPYIEKIAFDLSPDFLGAQGPGLLFFGLLGVGSFCLNLPFALYSTFSIEARYGFNKQTPLGFLGDSLKSLLLLCLLGGGCLWILLTVMDSLGDLWWLYAWGASFALSLFGAWVYPVLLAPLFNRFRPLEEGPLKKDIEALAQKISFPMDGVFVMDASRRSSHGNAYFTGVFGKKRIVLFDTLFETLSPKEILAVLAHELGHFKLHHVRWGMVQSLVFMGVFFYALSLVLPSQAFYEAFGFDSPSSPRALLIFSLWFGTLEFYLAPLINSFSRKNEFAADRFAKTHLPPEEQQNLGQALVKLAASNKSLPVSHPLYSFFYYSHPPLLERLEALNT